MQPLFGAVDDDREPESQEINIDEQERGPRAWPRAKTSGTRTRTSPRLRASTTTGAAPSLPLPPVCDDAQASAMPKCAPQCGAVSPEAEAEVELSAQQSESQ